LAGIAVRTLARRKAEGRFHTDESERLWRLDRVLRQSRTLFGKGGRDWLLRPCQALGGAVPLDLCDTEAGARQIELVLQRIAEGIPQ
jgi:putative toxin-antitoxin system antitoxin component (TIGR02293 family)